MEAYPPNPTPKPPQIASVSVCVTQGGDSNAGPDIQEMRVSLEDAGAGAFVAIQTERWACERPADLTEMIHKLVHSLPAPGCEVGSGVRLTTDLDEEPAS